MKIHNHKLVRLIAALLSEGITPHKIALTVALGAMLGVTPVLGTTTILCALAAVVFRINLTLIQVVNYLVYPLQLLLLIPFIQAGQWLFRQPPLPFTFAQLTELFRASFWHTLDTLWGYTLHGLVAWLILGGMTTLVIYMVLRPVLVYIIARNMSYTKNR
ncbi:MAG: DUF2062 domain-containing protein [Gammaproteobacteria bacterium]